MTAIARRISRAEQALQPASTTLRAIRAPIDWDGTPFPIEPPLRAGEEPLYIVRRIVDPCPR